MSDRPSTGNKDKRDSLRVARDNVLLGTVNISAGMSASSSSSNEEKKLRY